MQSLKVSCKGEYEIIDPSNAMCSKNMQAYNEASNHIYAIFMWLYFQKLGKA